MTKKNEVSSEHCFSLAMGFGIWNVPFDIVQLDLVEYRYVVITLAKAESR